jgi:hypothetical protein
MRSLLFLCLLMPLLTCGPLVSIPLAVSVCLDVNKTVIIRYLSSSYKVS